MEFVFVEYISNIRQLIEGLLRLAGQAQATARRREAASRCAATTKGNNEHLNVEKQRARLQRCETFDAKRPHFDQGRKHSDLIIDAKHRHFGPGKKHFDQG